MDKEKVCGTCRCKINMQGEWLCANENSENYGLETMYDDSCEEWEGH